MATGAFLWLFQRWSVATLLWRTIKRSMWSLLCIRFSLSSPRSYPTSGFLKLESQCTINIVRVEMGASRKDSSPISRLPDELLTSIFVCFRAEEPTRRSFQSSRDPDDAPPASSITPTCRTWVSIPKVCRRWRSVSLDCPNFWSSLLVFSPDAARMMVERARSSPLNINIEGRCIPLGAQQSDVFFLTLFTHVQLVSSLRLLGIYPEYHRRIVDELAKPLDRLSSLVLHLDRADPTRLSEALPLRFLRNSAPVLSSLSLSGVQLPWQSALFQANMTNLRLQPFKFPARASELAELLDALSRMPNLRYLELRPWVEPFYELRRQRVLRPVVLLSLSRLVIGGSDLHIRVLLSRLILSRSCSLSLEVSPKSTLGNTQQRLDPLRDSLAEHLHSRISEGHEETPSPILRHVAFVDGPHHTSFDRSVSYSVTVSSAQLNRSTTCCAFGSEQDAFPCAYCPSTFSISIGLCLRYGFDKYDPALSVLPIDLDLCSVEAIDMKECAATLPHLAYPGWWRFLAKRIPRSLTKLCLPRLNGLQDALESLNHFDWYGIPDKEVALREVSDAVCLRSLEKVRATVRIDGDVPEWSLDGLAAAEVMSEHIRAKEDMMELLQRRQDKAREAWMSTPSRAWAFLRWTLGVEY